MKHIPLSIVSKLSRVFYLLTIFLLFNGARIGTGAGLIMTIAGVVILIGTLIFVFIFSRCPHCNHVIHDYGYFCPYCGNRINPYV